MYQEPGWTQDRIDLLVVHLNNGWLMRRSFSDVEAASIDAFEKLVPAEFEDETTKETDVEQRDVQQYKTTCNNENIVAADQSYCSTWLRNFGDAATGGCGASRLCMHGTTRISASSYETTDEDYHVSCIQVANAVDEVWKVCGSRGGKYLSHLRA